MEFLCLPRRRLFWWPLGFQSGYPSICRWAPRLLRQRGRSCCQSRPQTQRVLWTWKALGIRQLLLKERYEPGQYSRRNWCWQENQGGGFPDVSGWSPKNQQFAIGDTDHLIVGRQQSGVDNLNGHDSSFMAVSIVYIVSHHKWFHDQQKQHRLQNLQGFPEQRDRWLNWQKSAARSEKWYRLLTYWSQWWRAMRVIRIWSVNW